MTDFRAKDYWDKVVYPKDQWAINEKEYKSKTEKIIGRQQI